MGPMDYCWPNGFFLLHVCTCTLITDIVHGLWVRASSRRKKEGGGGIFPHTHCSSSIRATMRAARHRCPHKETLAALLAGPQWQAALQQLSHALLDHCVVLGPFAPCIIKCNKDRVRQGKIYTLRHTHTHAHTWTCADLFPLAPSDTTCIIIGSVWISHPFSLHVLMSLFFSLAPLYHWLTYLPESHSQLGGTQTRGGQRDLIMIVITINTIIKVTEVSVKCCESCEFRGKVENS